MCLGIPGRITAIWDDRGTRMALVDFGGVTRTTCLAYLPGAAVGDYTIIHAGFALIVVDEAAAHRTLATFRDLGLLDELRGQLAATGPGQPATTHDQWPEVSSRPASATRGQETPG